MSNAASEAPFLDMRQHRAIAALMAHSTFEAAAQACGVHERTLRRWLANDADFRSAYRDEARALVRHVAMKARHAATLAIDTLQAVMADPLAASNAKVAAARELLEHAARAAELGMDLSVPPTFAEQPAAENLTVSDGRSDEAQEQVGEQFARLAAKAELAGEHEAADACRRFAEQCDTERDEAIIIEWLNRSGEMEAAP